MSTTVTASITNVPTKVGPQNWRTCARLMFTAAMVFGINEAAAPAAKRLYLSMARAYHFGVTGLSNANPVFWNNVQLRLVATKQFKLHGRGPLWRRWPGYNSARYATVAVFQWRRPERQHLGLAVINTHLAPRGKKVPKKWYDKVQQTSVKKLTMLVSAQVKAGRLVILMGDMNRAKPPSIRGVVWVQSGVDMIGVAVPAGHDLDEFVRTVFASPTDHKHGLRAKIVVS